MIRSDNIHKRYAAREVLCGVSLQVQAREIFGFVGPNGAGKTTFLKCLLGIAKPQSGSMYLHNVNVQKHPLAARKICAYAPSETAMYDSLSVWAMLSFCLACYENPDWERAKQLLDLYQLPHRMRVRHLSHGMKRKLLLTQALASRAPLLLLDEPMEGLDPEARRLFEQQLRTESAEGRTVFFSSHDLASVERVCSRVAFLRRGKLLACDSIENILEKASHTLKLHLRKPHTKQQLPSNEGMEWSGEGHHWKLRFSGKLEHVLNLLSQLPILSLRDARGGLEEVFEALYGPEGEAC